MSGQPRKIGKIAENMPATVAAQDWEFVAATTITNTQYLTFAFAAGYSYVVEINGGIPVDDAVYLRCQFSQSASYLVGATDYVDANDGATTSLLIAGPSGNQADEGLTALIHFIQPNVAGTIKRVLTLGRHGLAANTEGGTNFGGRLDLNTNACDEARLYWATGNWQAVGFAYLFRRILS